MADPNEPMVNVKEAAKHVGMAESTIYQMVSRDQIPHYKVGRAVRFRLSELTAWAKRLPVEA